MVRPPTRRALAMSRSHGDAWRKRSIQSTGRTSRPSTNMWSLVMTCGGRKGASPTVTQSTRRTVHGKAVSARSANIPQLYADVGAARKSAHGMPASRLQGRSLSTARPRRMSQLCLERGIDAGLGKCRHTQWTSAPPVHDHAEAKLAWSSTSPAWNLVVTVEHAVSEVPSEPNKTVRTWSNESCIERNGHRAPVLRLRLLGSNGERTSPDAVEEEHGGNSWMPQASPS
jgi:hypothetical protein